MIRSISDLTAKIIERYNQHNTNRVFTVCISGIDASGKGYITKLLQKEFEQVGYNIAAINIDPWQNSIPVRLQQKNSAENFYTNVIRWNDFFKQLIIPLQNNRHIFLTTDLIRTDADEYYKYTYEFSNTDIILVEGIFLFQEQFKQFFDYKIWIECSFETALQRAVDRNAEKIDSVRLIHSYESYYFPAQRFHFEKDQPRYLADLIFENDPGSFR
jgi:uridine kinase